MEFLSRHLKHSSRTNDEQRFEKVAVGKGYLGTLHEEWFDAPTTPFRSEEKIGKKPASKPASERSKQRRSEAATSSSEQGEASRTSPSILEDTAKQKGKQKQVVQTSPAEKIEEILPVLMKLYRLGEELVPLLVNLAKMGEEWSRTSAPSAINPGQYPWKEPVSDDASHRKGTTASASALTDDDDQLTPTASNAAADESRSKTPASTETEEDSALTPSTPLSNEIDGQSASPRQQSECSDPGFGSFKKICSTDGLLRRPTGISEHDICDGINDEATLQRFFDARKRDVSAAHKQFKEAWDAREANNLCAFYDRIGIPEFQETKNLYPAWSGRRDKSGQPICLFDFGKLDSKTMAAYRKTSEAMKPLKSELKIPDTVSMEMIRAFAVYEHLTRFIMPLCTAVPGRPGSERAVTKILCIVDISGIGLKQVWNLRSYLQDLAKLFATNYPEILSRVLIIGAPSYFPTIWGWIKKWVDPGTMAKLFILTPEEVLPTLQQYVEMADIPQRFGGEFAYYHGMQPVVDGAISDMLSWQPPNSSLPKGPMKWIDEGWERRAAVAVGSAEGRNREEKIAILRSEKRSRK